MSQIELPDLVGKVRLDTADLGKTVGRASAIGSAIGTALGGFVAGGVAQAAGAITGFVGDAIANASDLSEATNKIQVLFGDATGSITAFADTAGASLGQTQLEALDAAANFGVFAKAAGLAGDEAADFAKTNVTLASDLASFFNTDPADAADAIGAAMRGENEQMRQYGVLLDDASIRQAAFEMGLTSTTKKALTPQQRVLAVQAAIMKQTSAAQGDFARTSGGLANQQRILSAQFENFKGVLGRALLPVVTAVITALNGMMAPLMEMASQVSAVVGPVITQFIDTVKGLFAASGAAADGMQGGFVATLIDLAKSVQATVMPVVRSLWTFFQTSLMPMFAAIGTLIMTRIVPVFLTLGRYLFGVVVPAAREVFTVLAANLIPILQALVAAFMENVMPALDALWQGFSENVLPVLIRVGTIFVTVTAAVVKFAAQVLGVVIPVILRFIGPVLGGIIRVAGLVIGWVAKLIGWVIDIGVAFWGVIGKVAAFHRAVMDKVAEVVGFMIGLPGRVLRAVGDVTKTLWSIGTNLISGLIEGIKAKAGDIVRTVQQFITDKIPQFVKDRLGIQSPSRVMAALGRNVGDGLALGIVQSSRGVATAMDQVLGYVSAPGGIGVALGPGGAVAGGVMGGHTTNINVQAYGGAAASPAALADEIAWRQRTGRTAS